MVKTLKNAGSTISSLCKDVFDLSLYALANLGIIYYKNFSNQSILNCNLGHQVYFLLNKNLWLQ